MTDMRILTVRPPWAWAIIHGGKTVENRLRNIAGSYRGPIAIHVAQTPDASPLERGSGSTLAAAQLRAINSRETSWRKAAWDANLGTIIGVVDLTDVHAGGMPGRNTCGDLDGSRVHERCSLWGEDDTYHLILANPRPLNQPIPYRGALGLRTLDPDTTRRIELALAEGARS